MTLPGTSTPVPPPSRARQALILGGVVVAAAAVLTWGGWTEYESHSADSTPTAVDAGESVAYLGAEWGPLTLTDVTGTRDPEEDPLPDGARVYEAVLPVDPEGTGVNCRLAELAEVPSIRAVAHRPGAAEPRAWHGELFADLLDEVDRTDACDKDSSAPAELRLLYTVPGDISDDLSVALDISTDEGFERLVFAAGTP